MKRHAARRLVHERKIQLLALAAGLPGVLTSLILLYVGGYSPKVQWTLGLFVVGGWLMFASTVRERVASPLRTLANLLEAIREGDYSIRARGARFEDALGEVMQQVNVMGATLRTQRLGAMEATTLLRKVMEEIDVAIFAFDHEARLKLINREGERLIGLPAERSANLPASEIDLDEFLTGEGSQTVQRSFRGASGRWRVSRSDFREGGLPHQLLVIADMTRPLREEELQAWQRLVRVLGHELNNSLTPIKSIATSLSALLQRAHRDAEWEEDMARGLDIIATRSESLSRFLGSYARLARLPQPRFDPVEVEPWVRRIVELEHRVPIHVEAGEPMRIRGDGDQLDQLLINLIRNAADASLETGGSVTVGWTRAGRQASLYVRDEGRGLANTSNLFVPFFTTKQGGSGIGLVLSRQIAEAHGGALSLTNRDGAPGCEAQLTLPL